MSAAKGTAAGSATNSAGDAPHRDGLPRLGFDEVDAALQAELKPAVDRLGYFGEFFQVFAPVPGAMQAFMGFTKSVKAPLSDAENEVLALTVCRALGDKYERVQHERLSLKLGLSQAWIAAAESRPGSDPAVLSKGETALHKLALAVIERKGRGCGVEVAEAAAQLGAEKAAAALLQIGRFQMIAILCNTLSLALPVASIFDEAEAPE